MPQPSQVSCCPSRRAGRRLKFDPVHSGWAETLEAGGGGGGGGGGGKVSTASTSDLHFPSRLIFAPLPQPQDERDVLALRRPREVCWVARSSGLQVAALKRVRLLELWVDERQTAVTSSQTPDMVAEILAWSSRSRGGGGGARTTISFPPRRRRTKGPTAGSSGMTPTATRARPSSETSPSPRRITSRGNCEQGSSCWSRR